MTTHEHACELHAAELVRVNEVADLVKRLADPANSHALAMALASQTLSHGHRAALKDLLTLCWQTQTCVESYIQDMREEAAA